MGEGIQTKNAQITLHYRKMQYRNWVMAESDEFSNAKQNKHGREILRDYAMFYALHFAHLYICDLWLVIIVWRLQVL